MSVPELVVLRPLPAVLMYFIVGQASVAQAQCPAFCTGSLDAGQCGVDGAVCEGEPRDYTSGPCFGNGCGSTPNCRIPTVSGPSFEVLAVIHEFDHDGLWLQAVDRNGNTKVATYSAGQLASVAFPDGRSETFAYHPDGKLASITEEGVGGAASRTWEYTWTGDDLVRIDRPDGTAWEFCFPRADQA